MDVVSFDDGAPSSTRVQLKRVPKQIALMAATPLPSDLVFIIKFAIPAVVPIPPRRISNVKLEQRSRRARGAILAALLLGSPLAVAAPAPAPYPAKVVVIGIDAVSRDMLDPRVERAVTPNLGALIREGVYGELKSIWPLRTPQVWTSVATGKVPGQHGLWDHVSDSYMNPPEVRTKTRRYLTSAERRSKALWTILGERHMKTLSVGWISSWPAENVAGSILVAPQQLLGDPRQTTIKGSFWRDGRDIVAPASLWPKVKSLIVEPADVTAAEVARFLDEPPEGSPLYDLPHLRRYIYGVRWSLARASSVERITTTLVPEAQADLVLAYFQCPDSLLHRFWIFHKPEDEIRERLAGHGIPTGQVAELKRRFGGVVDACYRDVDERVGRILAEVRGPETLVLVVSDHGFGEAKKPHRMKDEPYSGDHRDDGVLIAAGKGVRVGTPLGNASVLDVTPTVLTALGLPTGEDMRGKPLTAVVGEEAVRRAGTIASYETKPQLDAPYADGYPPRKESDPPASSEE